ncbi:MAG: lipoyl(octanoyl) transferase LipB [Deltaproteobacteria bacterium]|nr:lipoyl(octanoyl) transferase LipB [Deltaproteobacteria bacterium]
MSALGSKTCVCLEMPLTEYKTALDLQRNIAFARQTGIVENDVVLILEHPPVFTLGRGGGIENLKASKAFLERKNIPVIPVERGGDITFHGPGQLVVYPIIDLTKAGLTVMDYVASLEEIMLRTASDWNVPAKRNTANRGIWIANKKLGSVGISVQRSVTFHGFALNVNLSLKPFKWIHPCGLTDVGVTSMAQELSQNISMIPVREAMKHHLTSVFGFNLVKIEHPEIYHFLENFTARDILMTLSRST